MVDYVGRICHNDKSLSTAAKSIMYPEGESCNGSTVMLILFKYLSPAEGGVDLHPPDDALPIFLLTTQTC